MLHLELKDTEWPFDGFTHTRNVARGIILLPDGKIAIHSLNRDDAFGKAIYLETPGGGVDEGETFEQAVIREAEEETGYRVKILSPIGEVIDAYNLIQRKNIQHYYLCQATEYVGKHFESTGDLVIQETKHLTIDEAIEAYQNMSDHGVVGLVKHRELPILLEAKKMMKDLGL